MSRICFQVFQTKRKVKLAYEVYLYSLTMITYATI